MKLTHVFLSLAIVFPVTSVTFAQTQVDVIPAIPVQCDPIRQQNHRYINWVYDKQIVAEDEKTVSVEFKTMYGSCDNGIQNYRPIHEEAMSFAFEERKISLFGSPSRGVLSRSETKISDKEVLVQLTFDKEFVFKKQNTRGYFMIFAPGEHMPYLYQRYWGEPPVTAYYPVRFWWDIVLTKLEDGKTLFEVNVGHP